MKKSAQLFILMTVLFSFGCAQMQGGTASPSSGGSSASTSQKSGGKQLTKEDLKRMGINETAGSN